MCSSYLSQAGDSFSESSSFTVHRPDIALVFESDAVMKETKAATITVAIRSQKDGLETIAPPERELIPSAKSMAGTPYMHIGLQKGDGLSADLECIMNVLKDKACKKYEKENKYGSDSKFCR